MAEPIPPPASQSITETHTLSDAENRKLVREELDLHDKYIQFVQGQIEKDRAFYKHLYAFAAGFIAFMITVAGVFSYTSVSQMRSEMKASIEQATKTAVEQLKDQTAQNLKTVVETANAQVNAQMKEYSASLANSQNSTRNQERLTTEQMRQATQRAMTQVARTQSALTEAEQRLARINSLANSNPAMPLGQVDPSLFESTIGFKLFSRLSPPDDVKELQNRLKGLGCYGGEINGSFDETTIGAVRRFNRLNHPGWEQLSASLPGLAPIDDTDITETDLVSPAAPHCSSTTN